MSANPIDLLIKNVRVVRPHGNAVHEADIAIAGGKFAKVAPGIDVGAGEDRARRQGPARLSRRGRRAHAQRHLLAAGGGRGERKQGRGDGRRDLQPQLLPHRPVLPEQGRAATRSSSPKCSRLSKGRFHVDYGYHLAPMDSDAHRRDPDADREARRRQLQDLHVLRLARAARRERLAARVPDDRRGRALRLRALRVRHARRPGGARADARARRADLAVAALRDGRDHDGLHEDRREGQVAEGPGGLQRGAPAALRRPGGVHRQLPGQRDGAAQHQPAAPELAQGGAGGADDGRRVPAHRLPARGDDRPPDARHRRRRPPSWPR